MRGRRKRIRKAGDRERSGKEIYRERFVDVERSLICSRQLCELHSIVPRLHQIWYDQAKIQSGPVVQ